MRLYSPTVLIVASTAHALLLPPSYVPQRTTVPLRAPAAHMAEAGDAGDDLFSKGFADELKRRGVDSPEPSDAAGAMPTDEDFNSELYAHLDKRPEYATSEFYKGLRSRLDVEDPTYDELARQRELLANTTQPNPTQGPSEVIELVLRALHDVDYPYPRHGIEVLMNYTGPGSSISPTQDRVTPEMLYTYFEESKYRILLEWRNIQYLRKLDVSLDNKRAFQPTKLKALDDTWVPVTFQLSKYDTAEGDVWLIDQFLVKTAGRRGEDSA